MNSTIWEAIRKAVANGKYEIYFLIGHNRHYAAGDVALRLNRYLFENGTLKTLPKFAGVSPVMWHDGKWVPVDRKILGVYWRSLYEWNTPITVLS